MESPFASPPLAAARTDAPAAEPIRRTVRTSGIVGLFLLGFLILALVGLSSGPVPFALALTLAVLPVPIWIALALWVDRFEPEPGRMIAFTFLWGATAACLIALILNTIGELVVGETLGGTAAEIYGGSISAPVVEESAKGAVIYGIYRWRREEFDGVLDGIVYATMVGLGFAMTENVLYYSMGAVEDGIEGATLTFVVRGLFSPFAHPVFTAMFGIGLGIAARTTSPWRRRLVPITGLLAAMGLHSLWNTAAVSDLFVGVYFLIMVPVFCSVIALVVVLRRREAAMIARNLGHYVTTGAVNQEDVAMLSSLKERRRARKRIRAFGGRKARRALADYQEAAAELAFHRERLNRGELTSDAAASEREQGQFERLRSRRGELLAMRGSTA